MTRSAVAVLFLAGIATPAHAELVVLANGRTLSARDHRVDGSQLVLTLRDRGEIVCDRTLVARILPDEVPYPEPALPAAAETPRLPRSPLPTDSPYDPIIRQVSARYGVDPELVRAVITIESGYRPRARSSKGAIGLMQVMPSTARQYGVRNAYDPESNIEVGIRHLRSLLARYPLALALAAYNAGEGAVARFRRVPPYQETEDYVSRVLALVGG